MGGFICSCPAIDSRVCHLIRLGESHDGRNPRCSCLCHGPQPVAQIVVPEHGLNTTPYTDVEIEVARRDVARLHWTYEVQRVDRWVATIDALQARLDEAERLLRNLVRAVEATDEASKGVFILAHVHGHPYDGPNHGEQLDAARAFLAKEPNK